MARHNASVGSLITCGNLLFTGSRDGVITVWSIGNLDKPAVVLEEALHPDVVVRAKRTSHLDALAVNADKKMLFGGSANKTIAAWRISDDEQILDDLKRLG